MLRTEVAVVGAGPAGLSAAIEAAKAGARTMLLDEQDRPGGQLVKQVHKFFGSKRHHASVRGIDIARDLYAEAVHLGVDVRLNTVVWGIFRSHLLGISSGSTGDVVRAEHIVLATGASENILAFPGSTLPGVMGAGGAQTLLNVHRVLPGRRVLMVGSGNVGLIVAHQLLQAGAEVAAIVEAAPIVGGYGVHAAKVRRAGIPIFVSHTIKEAIGSEEVEAAVIQALDAEWQPVPGTEKTFAVDTVCLALGLSPLAELAWIAGCKFEWSPELGGHVPIHDRRMETSVPGIYVAGDLASVEEACTAMEEGRIAGMSAAENLGYLDEVEAYVERDQAYDSLVAFRTGSIGAKGDAKQKIVEKGKMLHVFYE